MNHKYQWLFRLLGDHRMYIGISIGGGSSSSSQSGKFETSGAKSILTEEEELAKKLSTTEGTAVGTQTGVETSTTEQQIAKNIASQTDTLSVLDSASTKLSAESLKQTTSGKQASTGTAVSEAIQTQTTLDAQTQQVLQDLVAKLAGTGGEASDVLASRALTAETDLEGNIQDIVAGARLRGEKEIGRLGVTAAQQAGSSMNSIVQQLGIEGSVNLEVQLAELEASLGLQTRQIATSELTGVSGGAASAAGIADVLKGAQVTGTTQETKKTEDLVTSLQDMLGTTTGTVETATKQSQTTAEQQKVTELQTMSQLSDTLSQMDTTQMTTETATAVESLMKLLSSTEAFSESGTSSGSGRSKTASVGFKL